MEKPGPDKIEELGVAETPEDVAALYSWANIHGAKYRDFSASRREYRAQLRHRAAEQVREQALHAQAEAEAAAEAAEEAARKAVEIARHQKDTLPDAAVKNNLRQAEEAARTAAAERMEAARRGEAAAIAEAAARREEREIAEAHASAERHAARSAEAERRRSPEEPRQEEDELPGQISDPYTQTFHSETPISYGAAPSGLSAAAPLQDRQRRPEGYHPDDASGVRQIYRGPESSSAQDRRGANVSRPTAVDSESQPRMTSEGRSPINHPPETSSAREAQNARGRHPESHRQPVVSSPAGTGSGSLGNDIRDSDREALIARESPPIAPFWENPRSGQEGTMPYGSGYSPLIEPARGPGISSRFPPAAPVRPADDISSNPRIVSPFSQPASDPRRGRRAQDDSRYLRATGFTESGRFAPKVAGLPDPRTPDASLLSSPVAHEPGANSAGASGPAWLYSPTASTAPVRPPAMAPNPQASVAETLQHSRERVAARWYALKGVFDQSGAESLEPAPVRQKEIRTPVTVVFSLAGGVGKTSLVATIGRSLSSLGEKVLLTDTTSHGLLPFYFGASELRHDTVRTFSPPSGSTDAPIYLVSYETSQVMDETERSGLVETILNNSRGTHRLLIDLAAGSSWLLRSLARMSPTVLVPVAPDMNSVISLQAIEKIFQGLVDADGRPVQPYYIINQFDVSLPLHLDVREVLRRQLGDRLLPFVIHRAPEVSEALAEGMTVVDYSPDSVISADYMNIANWLRTIAAPATAGFRNVRWSER